MTSRILLLRLGRKELAHRRTVRMEQWTQVGRNDRHYLRRQVAHTSGGGVAMCVETNRRAMAFDFGSVDLQLKKTVLMKLCYTTQIEK